MLRGSGSANKQLGGIPESAQILVASPGNTGIIDSDIID
jgi:hypothetical protein